MESLGTFLRSEREARGLALEEVAAVTRVPVAALRSIDDDRLDDLPGEVFVRGFVKAYAQCIDIDPVHVLDRLDRPAPTRSLPLMSTRKTKNLHRHRIVSPALLLVLLLATLLLSLVLFRPAALPFSAHGPTVTGGNAG